MPVNRVQFQSGLSMAEFLDRHGQRCCVRGGRRHWQCTACRHQCSAISGTVFESTKLPLTRWFLAMQLLTPAKNNVAALERRRQLGVCYQTAWLVKHKLLEVMRLREQARQLDGRVEVDDAYLGGARSGGKRGRGSQNKVLFLAARALASTAQVVSDGLDCFAAVTRLGASHERVVTGGGAGSVQPPPFTAINTVLGNLKTALAGTYHAIAFAKYAYRYLAEVQYRFNRRFDLSVILTRLLPAAAPAPARHTYG